MNRRNFIQIASLLPFGLQRPVRSALRLYPKPFQDEKGLVVYPTGINELDGMIGGGCRKGTLNLVMGMTGVGKSALVNRINRSTNYCQKFSGRSVEEIMAGANRPVLLIDDLDTTLLNSDTDTSFYGKSYRSIMRLYEFAVVNQFSLVVFKTANRRIQGETALTEIRPSILSFMSALIITVNKLDYQGRGKLTIQKNCFAPRGELTI